MTVAKLDDVILLLGESKQVDETVTTSGGELELKKQRIYNSDAESGPCFLIYPKTLALVLTRRLEHHTVLYGYVLSSMTSLFFNQTVKKSKHRTRCAMIQFKHGVGVLRFIREPRREG